MANGQLTTATLLGNFALWAIAAATMQWLLN